MKKRLRKPDWQKITGLFLFLTLIVSIAFAVAQIILSPADGAAAADHQKLKSDYVLMLLQCVLGLCVMAIPSALDRRLSIRLPDYMYVLYFLFLYCAIYLGEVRSFYYLIPQWDTVLHAFSGAMLGALGFILVSVLNRTERIRVQLSPFFVSLFAFCFALAMGALWEIYEFSMDGLFSLNMQKFALADGTLLIGRGALTDTMQDLITDAVSSLGVTAVGFFTRRREERTLSAPEKPSPPAERAMRRKDREVTDPGEIADIIGRCDACRVGLVDGGEPYVVPMSFGFDFEDGAAAFYFHSAGEGRKIGLLKSSPRVCVELDCGHRLIGGETACSWSTEYESVVAFGRAEFLTDPDEKLRALARLMAHYAGGDAPAFDGRMVERTTVFRVRADRITAKRKKLMPPPNGAI